MHSASIIKQIESIYGIKILCDPHQKTIFKAYDVYLKKEVLLSLECLIDKDLEDPIYLLWYIENNAVDSIKILLDKNRLQRVECVKQLYV
ncbi:hypothetical protein JOD45_003000 [Scopulibacillus daqui]|uniref:Ankyrin repeat protein n=1 Tax=Scopulibacillus daqui TaxID=1469162 RepID=A0ABS2Q3I3_9BACL|nr:hypothetical protein [Scopulibacillus daqui]MBM7646766.1 hypothetical protein [Scopulibacillus daqui]